MRKKAILTAVLIMMMIVIGINWQRFYVEKNVSESKTLQELPEGEKYQPDELDILGSHIVEQEFVAVTSAIRSAYIDFKVWEQKNGSGMITVELQDKDGNVLASNSRDVRSLVQRKGSISTKFGLKSDLHKGETYRIVVRSEDVAAEKGCFLYVDENKGELYGDLSIDGEPVEGRLQMRFRMEYFGWKSVVYMFAVLLLGLLFVHFPLERAQKRLGERFASFPDLNRLFARLLFAASPVMSFFIMQRYRGYRLGRFLRLLFTRKGLLNIFLLVLLLWVIYLICNRTKYAAAILVAVSSIFGLANYFVWEFRGTPIMMADLASVGTAMNVADSYEYQLSVSSLWALVYTAVFLVMTLSLKSYRGLHWKKRICLLLAFAAPYSVFHKVLLTGTYLKDHGIEVNVWAPSRDYAQNGCLLSFFISYTYYRVETPEGYSAQVVEELAKKYPSDSASAENEDDVRPNVIAIMNEAFSDLNVDAPLQTSEDFMPYIRSLKENTVRGHLYMSIFGGNTANSEFEFLTGCSMAFLPFRAMPYNTFIKRELPSLTHTMKDQGYVGNDAVHPYWPNGWNRENVYPLLGFEHFYSLYDFSEVQYIRNFASDKTDFDFIISKYEESRANNPQEPFYTFSVTMQNHGGYKIAQGLVDTDIRITDAKQYHEEAEQYINLIKKSDEAFKELTEYFAKVEEPTVIVMFGDHQPGISDEFYSALFDKEIDNLTLEETIRKHTVPYLIWANYDIEEQEIDMSANYLSAYLLQTIGAKMTGFQKYLLDLHEKLPMITANGYRGDDGVLYEPDEESEYSELINEYRIIQYNDMFDKTGRVEKFFRLSE